MKNSLYPDTIRLSVVDDHPVIFLGIQMALKKSKSHSIELINHYINGNEVIIDISSLNSDVLLIDMCLPDIKGYELARLVLEKYPEMKIGIYSNILDRVYILNAFKSGVLGYLPKSANSVEIVEFIETISRGERYVRGIVANVIFENDSFFDKQQKTNITKRESEILNLILDGNKNKEIAKSLSIAERTVEFHKQNLYMKLEVNNAIDLYKAALRLNLVLQKDTLI
jgi:DNA-binding NarL/FixJ family response regulator